jgi:hypothetical protein
VRLRSASIVCRADNLWRKSVVAPCLCGQNFVIGSQVPRTAFILVGLELL